MYIDNYRKSMRKLFVLLSLLFCLSLSAMEYVGTLQMASGYTLSDVRVSLDEQGNLTLYRVKFSRMMPVRVDVVLPNVTLRQDSTTTVIFGDNIIPTMDGKPKPERIATQLQGNADDSSITFRCLLGGKGIQFQGK